MKKFSLILIASTIVVLIGCGGSKPKPKYPTYPGFDHDLIENVAPKPPRVIPQPKPNPIDPNLAANLKPDIPRVINTNRRYSKTPIIPNKIPEI